VTAPVAAADQDPDAARAQIESINPRIANATSQAAAARIGGITRFGMATGSKIDLGYSSVRPFVKHHKSEWDSGAEGGRRAPPTSLKAGSPHLLS
jgi:hypothetical protein